MTYDLSKSDLFKGVNAEDLDYIINNYASIKTFVKGEYIFVKGQAPKEMYILLEGALIVFSDDYNGKRELLASFREEGVLFAEVYLYLKKKFYHFSALTEQDTKVLAISRDFFSKIMDLGDPGKIIIENYLNILSEKLNFFNQKIRILSAFSLRQKLARYLVENSMGKENFVLEFNREDLADYLATTRPSVSRELSKMEEEGLIEINRSKVKILNFQELKLYL